MRCPTVIDSVLKIVKAPTNSAMAAKMSSAVEMNDSASFTAVESSLATVWPLTTSTPDGRMCAMARCSLTVSAPGAASTLIVSNAPGRLNSRCAVARSNPARVTPARLSAEP